MPTMIRFAGNSPSSCYEKEVGRTQEICQWTWGVFGRGENHFPEK